jgi:hypothetical protein
MQKAANSVNSAADYENAMTTYEDQMKQDNTQYNQVLSLIDTFAQDLTDANIDE